MVYKPECFNEQFRWLCSFLLQLACAFRWFYQRALLPGYLWTSVQWARFEAQTMEVRLIIVGLVALVALYAIAFFGGPSTQDQFESKAVTQKVVAVPTPAPVVLQPRIMLSEKKDFRRLKGQKADVKFAQIIPDLKIEGFDWARQITRHSAGGTYLKAILASKFMTVATDVGSRFHINRYIVAAMNGKESNGVKFLNGANDGGAGYIHKQFPVACELGLKVFGDRCNPRVLAGLRNKFQDFVGGRALRHKFEVELKYHLPKTCAIDDRFCEYVDVDATVRLVLTDAHLRRARRPELMDSALAHYSGRGDEYIDGIYEFAAQLASPSFMARAYAACNRENPRLRINGKRATCEDYVRLSNEQAINWGQREYQKLPRYTFPRAYEVARQVERKIARKVLVLNDLVKAKKSKEAAGHGKRKV